MSESNGEKKTLKFIVWTIFLGISTWVLVGHVQALRDIDVLKSNQKLQYDEIIRQLSDLKDDIKSMRKVVDRPAR